MPIFREKKHPNQIDREVRYLLDAVAAGAELTEEDYEPFEIRERVAIRKAAEKVRTAGYPKGAAEDETAKVMAPIVSEWRAEHDGSSTSGPGRRPPSGEVLDAVAAEMFEDARPQSTASLDRLDSLAAEMFED